VAVGGTVAPVDAAAVAAAGLDPDSAVLVPRYSLDRFLGDAPRDGTVFRVADTVFAMRAGHRVEVSPCRGTRPVRVPESTRFLDRIPVA
jgi:hypothetical protein